MRNFRSGVVGSVLCTPRSHRRFNVPSANLSLRSRRFARRSLYHILPKATWEKDEAVYFPATYKADGFSHLSSYTSQLVDVGNR